MQRNIADGGSADKHGLEASDGRKFAGASDLNGNIQNLRLNFFRRLFMGHGPARFSGDESQLFLAGKTIDFVDHAVNIKRQIVTNTSDF